MSGFFDADAIDKLISSVRSHGVQELELANGDCRLKIKLNQSTPSAPPRVITEQKTSTPVLRENESGYQVKSPLAGVFYSAPSPDSQPFVSVGKRISKGETLCIIEAMKMMNEIESEFNGVIKRILVSNGDSVESGQALFLIETD